MGFSAGSSKQAAYRGKSFQIPALSTNGVRLVGDPERASAPPLGHPILEDLHSRFDLAGFRRPRLPIDCCILSTEERALVASAPLPRVLDLPIKFPGSEYRIPKEIEPLVPVIRKVADYEARINPILDEYYCYLTIDRGVVSKDQCLREAPCHVDGFQGARFRPKVRLNHTYTVSDVLPTTYYIQPFDFSQLDEARHDFFWEMNRQVAITNSLYAYRPPESTIHLMDAYTVHRGSESEVEQSRTFVRFSYEVRIFDRLGNAKNPMFQYDWEMVPRDIEMLNLVAFDPQSDPSLRVFPHQRIDGTPHLPTEAKTKPRLRALHTTPKEALIWRPPADLLNEPGWVYKEELLALLS